MELISSIKLKDNSRISNDNAPPCVTQHNLEKLNGIANQNLQDLLQKNKNLFVFPHSLDNCKNDAGKLHICDITIKNDQDDNIKFVLQTHNLAGFISVGNLKITIQSRFAQDDKDYFLHYMLQKVMMGSIVNLTHPTDEESVFDFMLYFFPKLLNNALTQGLFKEYQTRKYNDANMRGVIDINRHIRNNIPLNGRVAYHTREFCFDNLLTQLVRHTIEYVSHHEFDRRILKSDAEIQKNVRQIIDATPTYMQRQRQAVIKKNLRLLNPPYFTKYAPLQKLCLQILRHEKLKYGSNNEEIYGILFDIAWLWEAYLATILMPCGFKHPDNRKKTGKIYLAHDDNSKNRFCRYPDFYKKKDDNPIIDAKYKRYVGARQDINQMITYMYWNQSRQGIFIKPLSSENVQEIFEETENEDLPDKLDTKKNCKKYFLFNDNHEIQIYGYPIPQHTPSFEFFSQQIRKSENKLKEFLNCNSIN